MPRSCDPAGVPAAVVGAGEPPASNSRRLIAREELEILEVRLPAGYLGAITPSSSEDLDMQQPYTKSKRKRQKYELETF